MGLRKPLVAVLALFYLVENVALATASESNLWSERRKSLQIAQLPFLPANAALPDSKTLLSTFPEMHQTLRASVAHGTPDWVQDAIAGHATVNETFLSQSPNAPTIFVVQDVHLHTEAQRNIAAVVDALTNAVAKKGTRMTVGLEGARSGPIDLTLFDVNADAELVKSIATGFLNVHAISGVEMAAISTPRQFNLTGVENIADYNTNVQALRDSAPKKKTALAALDELSRELTGLKKKSFDGELRRFDETNAAYETGKLGLPAYVMYLDSISPATTPNVRELVNAALIESSLNFKKVENERNRLIRSLVANLSERETKLLIGLTALLRSGDVSVSSYYEHLKNLSASHGLPLSQFPEMNLYIQYVLKTEAIHHTALFEEIKQLEELVRTKLARTDGERDMLVMTADQHLLLKLIESSMTESEWRAYEERKPAIEKTSARLAGLGIRVPISVKEMISGLQPFERFYTQALRRNDAMAKNILTTSPDVALLVVGGFHTNGVTSRLKTAGANVYVLTPTFTEGDDGPSSLEFLASGRLPLDEIFVGQKLFLPTAPVIVGAHAEVIAAIQKAVALAVEHLIADPIKASSVQTIDGEKVKVVRDGSGSAGFSVTYKNQKYQVLPAHGRDTKISWSSIANVTVPRLVSSLLGLGAAVFYVGMKAGLIHYPLQGVVATLLTATLVFVASQVEEEIHYRLRKVEFAQQFREKMAQLENQRNLDSKALRKALRAYAERNAPVRRLLRVDNSGPSIRVYAFGQIGFFAALSAASIAFAAFTPNFLRSIGILLPFVFLFSFGNEEALAENGWIRRGLRILRTNAKEGFGEAVAERAEPLFKLNDPMRLTRGRDGNLTFDTFTTDRAAHMAALKQNKDVEIGNLKEGLSALLHVAWLAAKDKKFARRFFDRIKWVGDNSDSFEKVIKPIFRNAIFYVDTHVGDLNSLLYQHAGTEYEDIALNVRAPVYAAFAFVNRLKDDDYVSDDQKENFLQSLNRVRIQVPGPAGGEILSPAQMIERFQKIENRIVNERFRRMSQILNNANYRYDTQSREASKRGWKISRGTFKRIYFAGPVRFIKGELAALGGQLDSSVQRTKGESAVVTLILQLEEYSKTISTHYSNPSAAQIVFGALLSRIDEGRDNLKITAYANAPGALSRRMWIALRKWESFSKGKESSRSNPAVADPDAETAEEDVFVHDGEFLRTLEPVTPEVPNSNKETTVSGKFASEAANRSVGPSYAHLMLSLKSSRTYRYVIGVPKEIYAIAGGILFIFVSGSSSVAMSLAAFPSAMLGYVSSTSVFRALRASRASKGLMLPTAWQLALKKRMEEQMEIARDLLAVDANVEVIFENGNRATARLAYKPGEDRRPEFVLFATEAGLQRVLRESGDNMYLLRQMAKAARVPLPGDLTPVRDAARIAEMIAVGKILGRKFPKKILQNYDANVFEEFLDKGFEIVGGKFLSEGAGNVINPSRPYIIDRELSIPAIAALLRGMDQVRGSEGVKYLPVLMNSQEFSTKLKKAAMDPSTRDAAQYVSLQGKAKKLVVLGLDSFSGIPYLDRTTVSGDAITYLLESFARQTGQAVNPAVLSARRLTLPADLAIQLIFSVDVMVKVGDNLRLEQVVLVQA